MRCMLHPPRGALSPVGWPVGTRPGAVPAKRPPRSLPAARAGRGIPVVSPGERLVTGPVVPGHQPPRVPCPPSRWWYPFCGTRPTVAWLPRVSGPGVAS